MDWRTSTDMVLGAVRDTFGDQVTYLPNGGTPTPIKAIFSNQFVAVQTGRSGIGAASFHPTLQVKLADLPSPPTKLDTVQYGSVTYMVVESQEDGYGGSLLILKKT